MHAGDEPVVEIVDVEAVGEERDADGVVGGSAQIEEGSKQCAGGEEAEDDFVRDGWCGGVRHVEEMLDEPRVTGDDSGDGEDDQRERHDERRFLGAGGVVAARFAEQDDEQEAEGVEGGEENGGGGDPESGAVIHPGPLDNVVLAERAAEERDAGEGESAGQHAERSDGHAGEESAHFPDILFVVEGDDDRARAEKEEALEEGVGEEVEHGDIAGRAHADADDHVAEL